MNILEIALFNTMLGLNNLSKNEEQAKMQNDILVKLSLIADLLQVSNFQLNTTQVSNDDLMKTLQKQNKDYLETVIEQNKEIIKRLERLEKK